MNNDGAPDLRAAGDAARRIRRQFRLGHPVDVPIEIVARRLGLLFVDDTLDGTRALLMRTRDHGVAVISALAEVGERRFDQAHELGHFILHPHLSHLPLCVDPDADPAQYKASPTERESDVFAREYLMPRAFVLALFGGARRCWETVQQMAQELLVSMTAAALRLVEIADEALALVHSTGGVIDWLVPNFRFQKRAQTRMARGRALPSESSAFSAAEGPFLPPREVSAEAWLPNTNGSIIEQSFGIPGGALTLLELCRDDQSSRRVAADST